MLIRTPNFANVLGLSAADRDRVEDLAQSTSAASQGMAHVDDYRALGAICCDLRPRRIFEIGTFLGMTSNFFLELLPDTHVISIAYVRSRVPFFSRKYNNSSLSAGEVGSCVTPQNRPRFEQLLGDSHELKAADLLRRFGPFDLIFIDGDHTHQGVALDTVLSQQIVSDRGGICWHDANPIPKYADVRQYLEHDLACDALATTDHYQGGVAYWHPSLATRGIIGHQTTSNKRAA